LDEEKSKCAGSAQENGSIKHFVMAGKRHITSGKECHKYDLTAAQCVSDWPIVMIGLGCLLLVVPHLFAVPVFAKK
jgi:hypothetical protein